MTLSITLPDGAKRHYDTAVTAHQVALDISPRLADAALAAKVNGQLVDLSHLISQDASLALITDKDDEALEVIRHSTAHLLAQATKQLFPSAQITIGPVIEDGFFYDIAFERPFVPEDLAALEARMVELAKQNHAVIRTELPRNDALALFKQAGEHYKAEIIHDIPEDQTISLYSQGDFTDLCRGPHVPSTEKLKAFKLTKLAGAYWRGDVNNAMLQRIYGTAWPDKKSLAEYLHRLEEAEKRDHRKLAKAMDLFHLQEEAPGMIFWHPNGWMIYTLIMQYLQNLLRQHGYQEVRTPQIADISLWEASGHRAQFGEHMFMTDSEKRLYAIKPMSCPAHVQIYNQGLKSYRDLPLRLAEFGCCHRNEPSGALHGIMRVRAFTQDDAHIFCTAEQIASESSDFIDLLYRVYQDFGFTDIIVKLSTRPEKRFGSDEMWDFAESQLAKILTDKGIAWEEQVGEGAFYGPKIEFSLKDCLGRIWQCGTLQLDQVLPERLGASFIAEDNERKTPFMLHRAICGSLERFIGILLEHYAGHLPIWLMPVQAVVLNITEKQADYAKHIAHTLEKKHFRVKADLRNEKINYKIRAYSMEKVPFMLVVGDREREQGLVAVRTQSGENLGTMTAEAFAEKYLKMNPNVIM